jgi:hypothetical protein
VTFLNAGPSRIGYHAARHASSDDFQEAITMAPVFPARRWLAFALLVCGLGVLQAAGQSSGTPPATSGQATTTDARMRTWRTHLDLGDASPFRPLHWEGLGPSLQGGRIEAIAVAAPGVYRAGVTAGTNNVAGDIVVSAGGR